MRYPQSWLALTAALALAGCASDAHVPGDAVSALEVRLDVSLPDGLHVIDTVSYRVAGNGLVREGQLDVTRSQKLNFRVGDIPVGPGYFLQVGAVTRDGVECAGELPFEVEDALVTTLALTMTCGVEFLPNDTRGDLVTRVNFVDALRCPVVLGLSALPAETAPGATLRLEGHASASPHDSATWTDAADGWFSPGDQLATEYTCASAGLKPLTLTLRKAGCDDAAQEVVVECVATQ